MTGIAIPYGAYWSTPFARWQGSLAHLHSLTFAAHVAKGALARREIPASAFDHAVLGLTVPQRGSFYGLPWLMGEIGAAGVAGPTISQACATGARVLQSAAAEIREGNASASLAIAADRTSNGPHLYYPAPDAPGGTGEHENWVLDNFNRDPFASTGDDRRPPRTWRAKYRIDPARAERADAAPLRAVRRTRSPTTRPSCAASWSCRSRCPTAASAQDHGDRSTATKASTRRPPMASPR